MKNSRQRSRFLICLTVASLVLTACSGSDGGPASSSGGNSGGGNNGNTPPVARNCLHHQPLRQAFFGDLHVHTVYSLDANTQGTIITPQEAYQFARGQQLGIQPYLEDGTPLRFAQLARPLDFAAVTDHAELFGEVEICTNPEEEGYNSPECNFYRSNPEQAFIFFNLAGPGAEGAPDGQGGESIPRLPYCGVNGERCLEAAKTPWGDIQRAAEAFYDRSENCEFTTFVAYEYTAAPQSNNLHRNVIFASEIVPELPAAYQENPAPEYLWETLSAECQTDQGCDYLTIPHNSNLSAGLMFLPEDDMGNPYTREFAQLRQDNEPLAEIFQHKGDSECINTIGIGMQDELCGFEKIPYNNLTGDRFGGLNTGPPMEQDFLRQALKDGLRMQDELGANPFKYGFIGSSDTHLGTPGLTSEEIYPGHGGAGLAASEDAPPGLTDLIENNPGGLAVLWAEQNTRESLFDAMNRREAYATTGTRPIVRFFGGADISMDMCNSPDFARDGYDNGVPMGADLPSDGRPPRFAVSALRDPGTVGDSTEPLQRIQIIKGWMDNGVRREVVYEVAGNPDNGASVDINTCETSGQGFSNLCAVWEDPDYDASQSAFWYARVVDNPSCRWSTRQCNAANIDCSDPDSVPETFAACCDADFPKAVQERAWTSPIWNTP